MDQSLALNALAPFNALAKSATSPRAAADLITQATSAANTYVFAELLQQPNIQALKDDEQYGAFFTLLGIFAWRTWEQYKKQPNLPELNDAQALKLRLLSLLTIAAEKPASSTTESNLSYAVLCRRLDLASTIDLEHLVTQAIYSNLINATLNPAAQTVLITSVSPLRDIPPGRVNTMIEELDAWSGRCDSVLASLEAEINKVKQDAQNRRVKESKAAKQIKAVMDTEKGPLSSSRGGHNTRGATRLDQDDDGDEMDVDGGIAVRGGRGGKKGVGGLSGFVGRLGGGGGRSSGR